MKYILIVLPNDKLGGAEQYLKNIANFYESIGCLIYVFFLKKKSFGGWDTFENNNNVKLVFTKHNAESLGVFAFIKNIFLNRTITYDFVFTSHIHTNALINLLVSVGFVHRKSHIGRESTSIFLRYTGLKLFFYRNLYKLFYSNISLLICQSTLMKNQLVNNLPILNKKIKIEVIPNPFVLKTTNNFLTNEDSINYSNFIVSAGRLIPEKGFDILIQAFKALHSINPDLSLVILGEGKERLNLVSLIRELELTDSVFLVGFVHNVYPYFKQAKLCVVSSRIEGFPNVLLQMMSQNDKVVSTTCAGDIDTIDGVFLAETHSVISLEKAMFRALDTNTTDNRKLFDKFLESRSVENFVLQIEQHLKSK